MGVPGNDGSMDFVAVAVISLKYIRLFYRFTFITVLFYCSKAQRDFLEF